MVNDSFLLYVLKLLLTMKRIPYSIKGMFHLAMFYRSKKHSLYLMKMIKLRNQKLRVLRFFRVILMYLFLLFKGIFHNLNLRKNITDIIMEIYQEFLIHNLDLIIKGSMRQMAFLNIYVIQKVKKSFYQHYWCKSEMVFLIHQHRHRLQ